jgi:hypothetical protein
VPVLLVFENIRVGCGQFHKGVRRTGPVNGTAITVHTDVMLDLKVHRAIAIGSTTVDTLSTSDAVIFLDLVLVIRFFDESSKNRIRWTVVILGPFVQAKGVGHKIGCAEVTVATSPKSVNGFHRRRVHHTVGFTLTALGALIRVDLPDLLLSFHSVVHQGPRDGG